MSNRCVMIMAGGTGGHVFPALSLAALLRLHGCDVVWLGTRTGIEARLVPAAGIEVEWVTVGGLRGKGWQTQLLAPLRLLRALWQAGAAIRRRKPRVVVGLGGYVTGPGGLAAWLLRRPLVIHEQNAIAGMTNRILARFAVQVLEAFGGSFERKLGAREIGNPVRRAFFDLPPPARRYQDHRGPLRILVVGGSQGAARLNAVVPEALAKLAPRQPVTVRHQSGTHGLEVTRTKYARLGLDAQVGSFIEDIATAYSWADIVICRAGALTVSEIAAAGVAAVFVPLPSAVDDHQTRNAGFLVSREAALLIPERELTPDRLAEELAKLGASRDALARMGDRAREIARPDAAEELARVCLLTAGLVSRGTP
jgi:UDP-N-acetylglucosamine--N-acetylmuramyl-(pentapeptide) pyrophosphoryl-undecaprenol N-acetylglucosamine transferase